MKSIVLDANVIAKVFIDESDSNQAVDLMRYCIREKIAIIAPELLRYEIANILIKKQLPINKVMGFFEEQISHIIQYTNPSLQEWIKAEEIAQTGHEKSGYPSMYDSIYQSIAIERNALFITADKRHFSKTESFGHILKLEDWEVIQA